MPDYSHETTREMMCRKLLEYGRIADQKAKLADQIVELAERFLQTEDPTVKTQLRDRIEECKWVDSQYP